MLITKENWLFCVNALESDYNAESRIRTHEGTKPIGPKPIPFGHSGISANVMSVRYQKLASQYLRIIEIDLFAV